MMMALPGLLSLAWLVCWIYVVVKMFGAGILNGVLGILCSLYAFIWGWMNAGSVGRGVMIAWTASWLVGIGSWFFVFRGMMAQAGSHP